MKKKSLLLAISAMSIAAIGVGTVGTFAWYQTTAKATVSDAEHSLAPTSLTTDTPDLGTIGFKLEATISIVARLGGGNSDTAMQLTTYDGTDAIVADDTQGSEDHFYFGYFVGEVLHYRTNQLVANKDFWRLYKVHVGLAVSNGHAVLANGTESAYTEAEALNYLAAETGTGKNGYSLAISRKSGETNNRAVFKVEASNATTASSAYTLTGITAAQLSAENKKVVSGGADYYFGCYIEGSNVPSSSEVVDDNAVTGGVTATATAVHVAY